MSVHQQLPHRSKDGAAHWMTASSVSNGLSIVHVLLGSKSKSEISSRKQFLVCGMLVRKATRMNIQSNIIQGESLVVGDGAGVFTGPQEEEECNTNQVSQDLACAEVLGRALCATIAMMMQMGRGLTWIDGRSSFL